MYEFLKVFKDVFLYIIFILLGYLFMGMIFGMFLV